MSLTAPVTNSPTDAIGEERVAGSDAGWKRRPIIKRTQCTHADDLDKWQAHPSLEGGGEVTLRTHNPRSGSPINGPGSRCRLEGLSEVGGWMDSRGEGEMKN